EEGKECYFYLDSTPTHSYMKGLYKYPQAAFPYDHLLSENRARGREAREYDLLDTGIFAESRYFDVTVEYAKASAEDILIRITIANRGPDAAELHVLPTVWLRNTSSRGLPKVTQPHLRAISNSRSHLEQPQYGRRYLHAASRDELLFGDNETTNRRLYNVDGARHPKDGINDYIVHGRADAVNPEHTGTKAAAYYHFTLAPNAPRII